MKIIKKPISKKIVPLSEQFKQNQKSELPRLIETIESEVDPDDLIPTGSTILNLECSGHIEGAFKIGKMVNLIGDSHSGKTLQGFTIFAECNKRSRFNNHRFILDDVEAANEFNVVKLFGKKCAERIDYSIRSSTIESFQDNISRLLESKKPFIYILDSFDGLTSEAAVEKDEENRKKREKGTETKGDFGDGKAKIFSRFCSINIQKLADNDSFLLVISQTRDNMGFGAQFTPKTRSGGKALKFYSSHEIWLACQKSEKEGKRTVRTDVQAKITKNKLTGRHGEALFSVLMNYGIDDIESCVDFLITEGPWIKKTGGVIDTKRFVPNIINAKGDEKLPKVQQILEYIETRDKEGELKQLCKIAYDDIMEKLNPKRKPKYI